MLPTRPGPPAQQLRLSDLKPTPLHRTGLLQWEHGGKGAAGSAWARPCPYRHGRPDIISLYGVRPGWRPRSRGNATVCPGSWEGPCRHRAGPREARVPRSGRWRTQAKHLVPRPRAGLRLRAGTSHTPNTAKTRQPDMWSPSPAAANTEEGHRHKTQMPSAASPMGGLAPSPEAHHCWSTGTAPRCRSCASPAPAETGRWALRGCRAAPSRRVGDGAEAEPQTQPSWLAQGVLERGRVMSTSAGQRNGSEMGVCPLHLV